MITASQQPDTTITLTDDQWYDTYKPVTNPTGDSGYFVDDDCLVFDWTVPADLAAIEAAGPMHVWTYMDDDDGEPCIMPGMHRINRIGYMITEVPHDDKNINVVFD
jgi:hypothetical protein